MELTIEQALQQGVAAHNQGDLQEAERLYRAILESQPTHPDANHNLGVLAVSINQAEAALPLFKIALDANPKIEQFWLSYIDALIKENQIKNAKRAIKKANKKGFSGDKLNALSEKLYTETLTANVSSVTPPQQQLDSLLGHYQNGSFHEAEKLAISITKEFPKYQFGWKALGAILGQIGKNSEAVRANQTAVELSPQDAESHSNLGITLQELGRLEEAEVSHTQAIALKPDFAEAHCNLGITLQELGRIDEANASLTQAIALKPDFAEAHNNLGITLQELGRLDEAEASYTQAIALKPDYAEAHSNLGNTLTKLGSLDDAAASYMQAIAFKPDFVKAHYNMGITLQELERFDEAEASYKQTIELKPGHVEAHYNLGVLLQNLGRLEEAEASYTQAIAFKSDHAEAHNNLGAMLQVMGRLYEAEASFELAIALRPDFAEAHNNLGNTLKDLGKLLEAEVCYEQALALNPGYAEASYNFGVLLFEIEKYNLAAEKFELADIRDSKLFAIQCSYRQSEETIFHEKFDLLVSQGENNAAIGSLALRSELKYGIKKSNPFCNDPLSYVVKIDLNELYDFDNIFIETARDALIDSSVSYKAQPALTNGVQTAGNIFTHAKISKTEIESIIHNEVEKYRTRFKNSDEGFIQSWPSSYEIKGWLVCMKSGGSIEPHMHQNGWLSGSIYINVPPKSKSDCGNLVLCLSDQKDVFRAGKNLQSTIDVETGSLCLFPSSLHHYTVPFEEKEDRIVLAFDVMRRN